MTSKKLVSLDDLKSPFYLDHFPNNVREGLVAITSDVVEASKNFVNGHKILGTKISYNYFGLNDYTIEVSHRVLNGGKKQEIIYQEDIDLN